VSRIVTLGGVSNSPSQVDVSAMVDDIRATVEAKRAAGEYPQELLDDLGRDFDIAAVSDPPEVLSLIQTARPLRGGKLVVLGKKVVRRLMAWYVRPIAEDQTRFNDAITRELRSLERRVEAIESNYEPAPAARLVPAATRVTALKKTLQGRTGPVLLIGSDLSPSDIAAQVVAFDVTKPRIGDRLGRLTPDSFTAVVFEGVLQRVGGREITALLKTAMRVLMPGGLVLVVGPDPGDPNCSKDPSSVDVSMRRWLSPDTVEALLDASGFKSASHTIIDNNPRWYLAVATRPE
jgi:hypothetical protein